MMRRQLEEGEGVVQSDPFGGGDTGRAKEVSVSWTFFFF